MIDRMLSCGVDTFSLPCTETAIAKRRKVNFYTEATKSDLEFAIPAAKDYYWDLNDRVA